MSTIIPRNFNCKNEELPVVCGFQAISLTRDLADFGVYSPQFTPAYVDGYKSKIDDVDELVQPKSETTEIKIITERMNVTLDSLISPINRLEGYVSLAGTSIPISATDFGLVPLRKSVRNRDIENVLTNLRTVKMNIGKYEEPLTVQGMTEDLVVKFHEADPILAADKKQKYTIVSSRMALVQNNMGMLNDLYDQFKKISDIGKILYKQTNKAKLNDYTFAYLMKQVRRVEKPEAPKPEVPPVTDVE